jgi:hypothetical protein
MVILLILLPIIINQHAPHPKIRNHRRMFFLHTPNRTTSATLPLAKNETTTHRILPQHKRRIVLERQITRLFQNLVDDPPAVLVFFLLEVPDAREAELDVGRNLECGSVECAGFLFREAGFVLMSE